MNKLKEILQIAITSIYGVMMVAIFTLLIFFTNVNYGRKAYSVNMLPALILILLGCFIVIGVYQTSRIVSNLSLKMWTIVSAVSFFIVCLVQLFAVKNYYFISDWDVGELNEISRKILHGEEFSNWNLSYSSMYPNNRFMLWLILQVKTFLHNHGQHDSEYLMLINIQCVINSFTGFITVKVADKLFNDRRISFCCMFLFISLVGISPWVALPYTDSTGLFIPVTILCVYLYRESWKYSFVNWIVIGCLSIIGVMLKPQLIIITIAIIITEFITFSKEKFNKFSFISIASFILSMFLMYLGLNAISNSVQIEIDENKRFTIHHYLMMGTNPEGLGVYNEDDVQFSRSFSTVEERQENNIRVAKERFDELGLKGLMTLYARKTLTNYNDGTFCWSGEGKFFKEIIELPETNATKFFRGLYYRKSVAEIGIYNQAWANFEQMIWLTTLFIGALSVVTYKDSKKNVLAMSIIGLTIFQTIFECRARYLYVYAPIYILLAVYGLVMYIKVIYPAVSKRIDSIKAPKDKA